MTPVSSSTFWGVVLAIHLIAMAAWVGGMVYALVVVRKALAVLDPAPRMQVHLITLRRFFLVVWHAVVLSILTGYAMIVFAYGGFAHLHWSINVMNLLGLVMTGVFLFLFFGPYRKLRRAIRPGPELLARVRTLVTVNLALGLAIIVVASVGAGLPAIGQ